jgi:hypothetical protein
MAPITLSHGDSAPGAGTEDCITIVHRLCRAGLESSLRCRLTVSDRDLERLQCGSLGEGTAAGPVVALFSTGRASEAVSMDVGETVFAQLPLAEEAGAPGESLAEAAVAPGSPGASPAETMQWRKLVVVTHSAYTGGMRVLGIMHREFVWLEWE